MKTLFVYISLLFSIQINAAVSIEDLYIIQAYPAGIFKKQDIKLSKKEAQFYSVIVSKLEKSSQGAELLRTAQHLTFQFAGFTNSNSKANTDPKTRFIRIREDLDSDTACLSLAYELSNVINSQKYLAVFEAARFREIDGTEYAEEIIHFEAEANLWRSRIAQELNLEKLIINRKYFYIATLENKFFDEEERLLVLIKELKAHGTVGKLKIPVVKHYRNQFDEYFRSM